MEGLPPRRRAVEDDPIKQALLAPLAELRERYWDVQALLERLSAGVEAVWATAAVKESATPRRDNVENRRETERPAPERPSPPMEVDLVTEEVDRILDFQERLARVEGVARVSIVSASDSSTRLLVELAPEPSHPGGDPSGARVQFVRPGQSAGQR